MRRLLAICCGAALVVLLGCQQTTPTGTPLSLNTQTGQQAQAQTGESMSPEQEQLLNKLEEKLDELEKHGMSLEDALERLQEEERAAAGPPSLVKDLWPAQRVLDDAINAARSEKAAETTAALDRLVALSAAINNDLPASQIMVRCERAMAYLSQNALDEAGIEMAMAYRVADLTKFATLVPEGTIALIQNSARSQISAGRPREAAEVVLTVLQKCSDHGSLARMERIDDAIAGAYVGVERGAWPVVEAELGQADAELRDLAETIRPERWDLTSASLSDAAATADEAASTDDAAAETDEAAAPAEGATAPEGAADQGEAMETEDAAPAADEEGDAMSTEPASPQAPATEAGSARPRTGRRSR